jgi:hypothetical protein
MRRAAVSVVCPSSQAFTNPANNADKKGRSQKVIGNIETGALSNVAAGSVVVKDIPPGCTVAGIPVQIVRLHPTTEMPPETMDQSCWEQDCGFQSSVTNSDFGIGVEYHTACPTTKLANKMQRHDLDRFIELYARCAVFLLAFRKRLMEIR